jgi:glycosyltransferase involved in cell wall biosynthesis
MVSNSPLILYINQEMAAGGPTVHRDEFVRAARALEANLTIQFHPRIVGGGVGSDGVDLWRRIKQWLYHQWTDLALLLMAVKHAPASALMILKIRPQVLLLRYTFQFPTILVARILGLPVVLEINAPYYLHARYAQDRLRFQALWQWLERRAIGLASAVVVISKPLFAHYLSIGFPPGKFTIVPNGVDLSRFNPATCGKEIRLRYRVGEKLVIGFVGRLEEYAGIDWFLEHLPDLGSAIDDIAVLIVGTGPLELRLHEIVAKLDIGETVSFTGFVPHAEIPNYIAGFDVAVAPYRKVQLFYGSPMKICEYLAMGKPVVTPRMGQSEELIQHGENGMMYEPDDAEAMLALLRLLIQDADLRLRLGRAAQARVLEVAWTWEQNAAAILKVCRAVAVKGIGARSDS